MEDTKQFVKKWLHDNVVTVVTILLFALILGALLLARYGSLYSIRNISSINPLITSESAELVAVNVNGVVRILKDEDGNVTDAEKKEAANEQGSSSSKSGQGSAGGNSNGVSSSGGSTGGTSSGGGGGGSNPSSPSPSPSQPAQPSPSPSPSPSQPPIAFTGSILSLQRTNHRIYDKVQLLVSLSCKNDHTFQTQVKVDTGSGTAKLRWRYNNQVIRTDDYGFMSAGNTESSSILITTQTSGSYSITTELINGANSAVLDTRTTNFSHSCS